MKSLVKNYLNSFFYSASYLLISQNYWVGFCFFIFLCFYPAKFFLVVVSFLTTILAGQVVKINRYKELENIFIYNSHSDWTINRFIFTNFHYLLFLLTVIVSIFTLLLSYALSYLLHYYFNLPLLNLPYAIIAILLYLSANHYSNLLITSSTHLAWLDFAFLPVFISGFLKSLGALIFMPYDLIGLILLLIIFIFSKINFFIGNHRILPGYADSLGIEWFFLCQFSKLLRL